MHTERRAVLQLLQGRAPQQGEGRAAAQSARRVSLCSCISSSASTSNARAREPLSGSCSSSALRGTLHVPGPPPPPPHFQCSRQGGMQVWQTPACNCDVGAAAVVPSLHRNSAGGRL